MDAEVSPLQELTEVIQSAQSIHFQTTFELDGSAKVTVGVFPERRNDQWIFHGNITEVRNERVTSYHRAQLAQTSAIFREVVQRYPDARLLSDTVDVRISKGSTNAPKAKRILIRAWHEAYGWPIPTMQDLTALEKQAKAAKQAKSDEVVELLKSGRAGIQRFNDEPLLRVQAKLAKTDFSGCDLRGVWLQGLGVEGATFANANLANARFCACRCREADFSHADLLGASFAGALLTRAKFVGANLSAADFRGATLNGADLMDAVVDNALFERATFDDQTRWTHGARIPDGLVWKGSGPDPRRPSLLQKNLPPPTDFEGFLERLGSATEEAKLNKALSMLKAERFQLFAKVTPDQVTGVVKSQSDPSLVYSCRLGSDGNYACCTQNLNVCGGLRGSPCKHLLVLIIGLAKAGALDSTTAHDWVMASRGKKAALDKDAMTETLLQYKGAEAGEVDWRPTETIPEDFYAM